MSMKIERSTLDQVKARFAQNKRKLEEKKKDYDLEQRVKELKEEVCIYLYLFYCIVLIFEIIMGTVASTRYYILLFLLFTGRKD